MILYVDMEHASARSTPIGKTIMAGRMKIKYRVEAITEMPCLIAHYSRVDLDFLNQFDFQAILLSGSSVDPEHYLDLDGFNQMVLHTSLPILGLCGGWQFMAQAFGSGIEPLGKLPEGRTNENEEVVFREGYIQEYGFHPVEILEEHPLLAGLGKEAVFWHAHYMEVRPVPAGFRVYAQTDDCAVQFASHVSLPRYGTQFHPEYYSEENNAGQVLLKNFFQLAGVRTTNG